ARRRWTVAIATVGVTWGACGMWAGSRAAAPVAQEVYASPPADPGYVTVETLTRDSNRPATPAVPEPEAAASAPGAAESAAPETVVPDADGMLALKEAEVNRDVARGWVTLQRAPDAPAGDGANGTAP